jgi:hypothetical protein
MKQLMVISHDTYASGLTVASSDLDDLASLAVGAYAIIDKDPDSSKYDGICDLAATSESETPTKFMIVTMTANGLKHSPIIDKATCKVHYQAYVAPVAKIMNIAVTYSNLEAGQVAGFIVTDTTKGAHELTRNRSYNYTVTASDTSATIIAALIALVNADSLRCVNATAGTNIVLTRITAGKNFQVSPTGITRGATITTSTYHVTGTGTAVQLLAYEKECNIERGKGNYPQYSDLMFTAASEVNSTTPGTYNTLIFRFSKPTNRPIIEGINPDQELVLAILSTLTAAGTANKSMEAVSNLEADFNV